MTIDVWRDFVVTFDSKGGSPVASQVIAPGGTATAPAPPTRAADPAGPYDFVGWTLDPQASASSALFDFSQPIPRDVILYAIWTQDAPYTFTGFLAPVDNLPMLNVGQAGRTFPIKWRLANADGTPVTALTSFTSFSDTSVPCEAAPSDVLEEQLAATSSGIRYDAAENLFIYNWKTVKGAVGCRLITVTLDDGSQHYAKFQLKVIPGGPGGASRNAMRARPSASRPKPRRLEDLRGYPPVIVVAPPTSASFGRSPAACAGHAPLRHFKRLAQLACLVWLKQGPVTAAGRVSESGVGARQGPATERGGRRSRALQGQPGAIVAGADR